MYGCRLGVAGDGQPEQDFAGCVSVRPRAPSAVSSSRTSRGRLFAGLPHGDPGRHSLGRRRRTGAGSHSVRGCLDEGDYLERQVRVEFWRRANERVRESRTRLPTPRCVSHWLGAETRRQADSGGESDLCDASIHHRYERARRRRADRVSGGAGAVQLRESRCVGVGSVSTSVRVGG